MQFQNGYYHAHILKGEKKKLLNITNSLEVSNKLS